MWLVINRLRLFADSADADIYNPEVIARAIVNGLVGAECSSDSVWKWAVG